MKISVEEYDIVENNTDVEYSQPENLSTLNPIADNKSGRRYIPLTSAISKFTQQQMNNAGVEMESRYDASIGQAVTVYFQMNTKNQSFLDMHHYLKARGIKNNKFHLLLYDRDLAYVDPYDPMLPIHMKQKIFVECQRNFWYYCREVVRVPSQGGPYVQFRLDRGNLALNFCFTLNLNIYQEQPRQTGKTVGAEVWYSWVYNFGSRNANMVFLNKKHDDAKRNLSDLKNLISSLRSSVWC